MRNNLKEKEKIVLNDENVNKKAINQEFKKQKTIKVDKVQKSQEIESFDHFYGITKTIRDRVMKPPKNSLSELVYYEKLEELEVELKKESISPDTRDESGTTFSWTPLYWSVKYKKIECVKLLLHYGADINMVINDLEECCGTVLDLATLRGDETMESLLRAFAEKDEVNLSHTFKAIRTKLRGKAPAFNFNCYGKKKAEI
ncbi:hypothetical protein GW796_10430 [archaeon]|nr:hypothetical protein [archaeon]